MQKIRSNAPQKDSRVHAGASNRPFRSSRGAPTPKQDVASAVKTRNLKILANVAGVDNLAMALGMSLPRVNELLEGFNFSDETAHHIELTLGLTSGFIDQVNPRLTEVNIQRLKSPLEVEDETPPPDTVRVAPPLLNKSKERTMPAKSKETELAFSKTSAGKKTASPAAKSTPVKAGPVLDEETLREIRRSNLMLLTTEQGFKSELGRITGMSPANISHRLHGNKHFDEETGIFFSEKLGLPADWFNKPHQEKDIPAAVLTRLRQKTKPSAARAATPVKVNASIPTTMGSSRAASPSGPTLSLSAAVLSSNSSPAAKSAPVVRAAAAPVAARVPAMAEAQSALQLEECSAPVYVTSSAATEEDMSVVLEIVRSGEPLGAIAEALLKTLAAKARQGRLSEEKAFSLLTSAMAL